MHKPSFHILRVQLIPNGCHILPTAVRPIYINFVLIVMKNMIICLKKDVFSCYRDMPYICKLPLFGRDFPNQRMVNQGSSLIGFEISYFILSSYINSSLSVKTNRAHNSRIGQRIHKPIPTIKGKQSLIIAKIHDTLCILGYTPVLDTSLIHFTGIVCNLRHRYRSLRKAFLLEQEER